MDYKLLFKTAMLAGEIMSRSGAETYRIEDTMKKILEISHFKMVETYSTTTGIIATLDDPSIELLTAVKRIDNRSTNLNHICLVNNVSRELCIGNMSVEEAYQSLLEIKESKLYGMFSMQCCTVLAAIFFTALFKGGFLECIVSGVNGLVIVATNLILRKRKPITFIDNLIKTTLISLVSRCFIGVFPTINIDVIIIGTIMQLVPGVAITNAIRDTLQGDYMSGVSRTVEAFIVALSIAVGVGIGLSVFDFLIGGNSYAYADYKCFYSHFCFVRS